MYNQPYAGGWRFGDRPSSVQALYQAQTPDNDFLKKVAAMAQGQDPAKTQGLLDQQLEAQPLTGLLDAPGSQDGDQSGGTVSGATGIGVGNMSNARDSAALSAAGMGMMKAGGPGLLGLVNGARAGLNTVSDTNRDVLGAVNSMTDPIAALNAIQGWTDIDQAYMDAMRNGMFGGGPDYGGFANDFGGSSAGADSGVGAGGTNNGGYGANGGFGRDW